MPLKRISITIPESVVSQADERARALDRSRSWLVVEALRRYLAQPLTEGRDETLVKETTVNPYVVNPRPGLGPYRRAQLEADLCLTPEQRVKEAERTARVAELRRPPGPSNRLLIFDSYDDYLAWDRRERLTP